MASLRDIVSFCDKELRAGEIEDYPGAKNGLQLQNVGGQVTRIAAAVDAHIGVIEAAVESQADLLLVHHGLFWGPVVPLTGTNFHKFKLAVDNGLAVYSSHLPLDLHPVVGNNAGLAKAIGLNTDAAEPFFFENGQAIGMRFRVNLLRDELAEQVAAATEAPLLATHWHGAERVVQLGIVTGGAGAELPRAAREGVDTFITGEAPNHAYGMARELGLNVILGGHYATETFGVKALASLLSERFGLPWHFLHIPTGL